MAKIEKDAHLQKAKQARSHMAANLMAASENIFLFSFDLEEALPFPKLTKSITYYKQNLYVYYFGYHDFNKNISHMFIWPETERSRGSQEIFSCLVKLKNLIEQIYSIDPCFGCMQRVRCSEPQQIPAQLTTAQTKGCLNMHQYVYGFDFRLNFVTSKDVIKLEKNTAYVVEEAYHFPGSNYTINCKCLVCWERCEVTVTFSSTVSFMSSHTKSSAFY
uniref:Uncharacterized protein n=1 Tax=Glossina austeni TaxID=7395 RepID=A0A1A9VT70_GLOAU